MLVGEKINKLTLIESNVSKKYDYKDQYYHWLCKFNCDCGGIWIGRKTRVITGRIKSCGCLWGGRLPNNVAAFNIIIKNYIAGAKRRKLSWELSNNYAIELCKANCFYCGSSPRKQKVDKGKNGRYSVIVQANGIDRLDNSIGYTITNCVSACMICNRFKWNNDFNVFINQIKKIYEYLEMQNTLKITDMVA